MWPSYSKTRFPELGLCQQGAGLWRFVATDSNPDAPAVVGPQYRTKTEALADLERYHAECWAGAQVERDTQADVDSKSLSDRLAAHGYKHIGSEWTARRQVIGPAGQSVGVMNYDEALELVRILDRVAELERRALKAEGLDSSALDTIDRMAAINAELVAALEAAMTFATGLPLETRKQGAAILAKAKAVAQ